MSEVRLKPDSPAARRHAIVVCGFSRTQLALGRLRCAAPDQSQDWRPRIRLGGHAQQRIDRKRSNPSFQPAPVDSASRTAAAARRCSPFRTSRTHPATAASMVKPWSRATARRASSSAAERTASAPGTIAVLAAQRHEVTARPCERSVEGGHGGLHVAGAHGEGAEGVLRVRAALGRIQVTGALERQLATELGSGAASRRRGSIAPVPAASGGRRR